MQFTVFVRPRIELRSLGKIEEGEELTVAYVDFMNLSEERQRLLKTQYFFDCTCEHCTNHTKDDLKVAGREVDGVKVCETFCLIKMTYTTHNTQKRKEPLTTYSPEKL